MAKRSRADGSLDELDPPRGGIFYASVPFSAVESFARARQEPGRDRGRHYPLSLTAARAAFYREETGTALGRWLTLEPGLLLEPCECVDPIHTELFVQLGQHREELLLARSTEQRRAARDWLRLALFGANKLPPRSYDEDLVFDTFYAQDAAGWANLIRHRLAVIHPGRTSQDCASLLCARQHYIRAFIGMQLAAMCTHPQAGLRNKARAVLKDAFLTTPGGWALAALEPEDVWAVYRACLDWLVRVDAKTAVPDADGDDDTIGIASALSDRAIDTMLANVPKSVRRAVVSKLAKPGACELAGHLLGCSAETVRRAILLRRPRPPANRPRRAVTDAFLLAETVANNDATVPETKAAERPSWDDLAKKFADTGERFMRADYISIPGGDRSARVAAWSSNSGRAKFERTAAAAGALLLERGGGSPDQLTAQVPGIDLVQHWLLALAAADNEFQWDNQPEDGEEEPSMLLGTLHDVVRASVALCTQQAAAARCGTMPPSNAHNGRA